MTGGSRRPGPPGGATDGGREVIYEETLSMADEEGARNLIRLTRVAVLVLAAGTLVALVLVVANMANTFVSTVGGVDVALSVVNGIRTEQPLAFGVLVLAVLLLVGYALFSVVGVVLGARRISDNRVRVSVTADGVVVQQEGGGYWQSSGVAVPFDAITAVEYLDPDESSFRVEVGDLRAPKFFAGRRQNWVRLERATEPAVYVGSDSPVALAETVARNAPGVDRAKPF